MVTVLKGELGPQQAKATVFKAKAISHLPDPSQEEDAPIPPLSTYLVERPQELSEVLAKGEGEGEDATGLQVGRLLTGTKFRMGWYCVPRATFDFAPAALDPFLTDRAIKEPDEAKIQTSTLLKLEKDACTLSLIASFSDVMGASAKKLAGEALREPELPQSTKDRLQTLDLEQSRGKAVSHALLLMNTVVPARDHLHYEVAHFLRPLFEGHFQYFFKHSPSTFFAHDKCNNARRIPLLQGMYPPPQIDR